ncbi:MAG TPA: DNA gyrase subunit A [Thermoflexales bacterium]|nr:DNA gyrase subunit A [Thermoflexales bacterium]HQX10314.1 DNA gyrase subunit A [Thermoflexales bacterium]HQZ54758.1 DNA gyrase subunit A [Thermoflexales bacterium]HRA52464.1 DNA gyrase subunit A [Thermoflexales bacterium]
MTDPTPIEPELPAQDVPASTDAAASAAGDTLLLAADAIIEPGSAGRIRLVDIDREVRGSYLDYAMSVIVSRALPDSRDGLKPVQRRILFVMHDTGARASAPYRKSARVVGDVLGKYHPHGDASVYDAMSRMAQDFSLRYMLVDGQGNFGSVDGDPPAAMRYTEVRLSRLAEELLTDLEKDTVDWQENYDGTLEEPKVLPALLPNLLLNGATGIAVGMATNIPPHNIVELCGAINLLIEKWEAIDDVSLDDLVKIVTGPDFPTGGLIIGREGIQQMYATGRGRLVIRGVADIEEMKKADRFQIIVTELPYQVNKALWIERVADLAREGRIEEISDLRDESDRNGMRVVIELRRGAQPNRVLNRLYKFSALQTTFGAQILALVDGQPRLLSLKRALMIFIEHRREVIRRRTEFELAKAKARAHILEGLRIAIEFLDEVIRIIRGAPNADGAKSALIARFGLSDLQAQAILDLQLRRLAALERQKIEDEYQECMRQIAHFEDLLANPGKILGLIRDDCQRLIDKYGDERRTQILGDARESFEDEELIADKHLLISLTQRGYVKSTLAEAYRAQNRGGRGSSGMATKEDDEVMFLFSARSHDTVLFFSNLGKVYALRAYQIPEADRAAKGMFLSNLIAIGDKERITAALPVSKDLMLAARAGDEDDEPVSEMVEASDVDAQAMDLDPDQPEAADGADGSVDAEVADGADGSAEAEAAESTADDTAPAAALDSKLPMPTVAMCTRRGRIKRVDLSAFANIRSSGLICMSLVAGDELTYVRLTTGSGDVLIVTAMGQALRFGETLVRRMGRAAGGVRAMRLKREGDYIAGMEVVEPGGFLLTVTERGYGKRTTLEEYTAKGRGGGGMRTMTSNFDATGRLVAARVVQPTDQVTLITADGVALRQKVTDIPASGRATKGSRLINPREGDTVASVARLME